MDPGLLERITARRAELDELEEQLAKVLSEVRAERDKLAVAERVLERVSEQLANERASAMPTPGQVGGRAVMLIPHRAPDVEEAMLPPDYQRILAAVRQAAGPVIWVSAARPGRTHDNTAARHDHILARLRTAGLGALADLGSAAWTTTYVAP
ncbi:hypothetical protein [Streptomyces eurythermus]|uniref:hypothetical protein n=1 Tax=Streptomyces eurythermus TaxID=42237 RepID=UPI0033FE45C8